jgi:Zn-finger nucleic acid-binding protein
MSDRQGIEIDYCPQCRGVWLDRGELDKIIERSEPPARSLELPRETGHSFGRDREFAGDYHKKRKKSFLHELFD